MAGIKLNFDKDGQAVVEPPRLPLCMGWIPCENLIEKQIDGMHCPICKILGLNVHEIFDRICIGADNPCPKNIWYCEKESWYYWKKKSGKCG